MEASEARARASSDEQPDERQGDAAADEQEDLEALDERTRRIVEQARTDAVRARRELRAAQQTADTLRAEREQQRLESESAQERAIREAVEAERQRLTDEFEAERLQNRIHRRAAGRLIDPEDAVLRLSVDLQADADDEAIDEAIGRLVEAKPHLAAAVNGATPRGGELVSQGGRSEQPGRSVQEQSADAWIRARRRS